MTTDKQRCPVCGSDRQDKTPTNPAPCFDQWHDVATWTLKPPQKIEHVETVHGSVILVLKD